MREIAVSIGLDGETNTLYDAGCIVVYQREQGVWKENRRTEFQLPMDLGLKGLRSSMAKAVAFLGGCKVFVAKSITGVPFFELEKTGFNIWEIPGKPEEFLEYVWLKEEEEASRQNIATKVAGPEDLGNGCFRISLKEAQNSSGLTSKQLLQPFFRSGSFYQLEILCTHIPPWIEAEALSGGFECSSEVVGPGEIKLLISKKVCDS